MGGSNEFCFFTDEGLPLKFDVEHKFAVFANLGFRYLLTEGNEPWENSMKLMGFEKFGVRRPIPMMQFTIGSGNL